MCIRDSSRTGKLTQDGTCGPISRFEVLIKQGLLQRAVIHPDGRGHIQPSLGGGGQQLDKVVGLVPSQHLENPTGSPVGALAIKLVEGS